MQTQAVTAHSSPRMAEEDDIETIKISDTSSQPSPSAEAALPELELDEDTLEELPEDALEPLSDDEEWWIIENRSAQRQEVVHVF